MDDCVKKRITQSRGVTHGYLISEVLPKAVRWSNSLSALLTFVTVDSIYLQISAVWQIWFLMIYKYVQLLQKLYVISLSDFSLGIMQGQFAELLMILGTGGNFGWLVMR